MVDVGLLSVLRVPASLTPVWLAYAISLLVITLSDPLTDSSAAGYRCRTSSTRQPVAFSILMSPLMSLEPGDPDVRPGGEVEAPGPARRLDEVIVGIVAIRQPHVDRVAARSRNHSDGASSSDSMSYRKYRLY